jgi:hypothetical protein
MVHILTRRLLTAAVFAAVLWGGLVYAAINTVCADTGVDW